jgi:hypothetical protein
MTVREPSARSSDDGAPNWPEAPTYTYGGFAAPRPLLTRGVYTTGGLGIMAFTALDAFSPSFHKWLTGSHQVASISEFVFGAALGLFCILFGVWMARAWARICPGIALSADGVFAYLMGKPWRFIAWREMESITKGHDRSGKPSLGIKGPRYTIQVGGRIDRFADLCECVTRYARDHGLRQRPWGDWSNVGDIAEP